MSLYVRCAVVCLVSVFLLATSISRKEGDDGISAPSGVAQASIGNRAVALP